MAITIRPRVLLGTLNERLAILRQQFTTHLRELHPTAAAVDRSRRMNECESEIHVKRNFRLARAINHPAAESALKTIIGLRIINQRDNRVNNNRLRSFRASENKEVSLVVDAEFYSAVRDSPAVLAS